jgi:hypothetical protein
MNKKEFENYLKRRLKQIVTKAVIKQKEYSRNNDAFHSFKRQAFLRKHSAIDVLATDWSKHLVSLMDIVNDIESGKANRITLDTILEKSGDNIIYSIIFEAMTREILRKK